MELAPSLRATKALSTLQGVLHFLQGRWQGDFLAVRAGIQCLGWGTSPGHDLCRHLWLQPFSSLLAELDHLNFTGTIFWEGNSFWAPKPCLSARIKLKQRFSCFSLTEPFSLSTWDANELGSWILPLDCVRVLTLAHLSCLGREESYQHPDFRVISDW